VPGVTADTNIYISGIQYAGLPRRFLDLARMGAFRLDISPAIMQEVLRVLRRKFEYSSTLLLEVERKIGSITRLVIPVQTLDVITTDPSDNRILECAVAAHSDFIVSGDNRHILPLGSYGAISILRVADFLKLLESVNEGIS